MEECLDPLGSGALRIAVRGVPVVERYAGTEAETGSGSCTASTRFQIASISKQFTAAAVLVLVQERRLSVGDRLARWFPGGPPGWDAITVHQLLSHTSGLGHWDDFSEIDIFVATNDEQLLEAILGRQLLYAPGSHFSYSSPGYCLLARIVEQVSESPYSEFVMRTLLEPSDLADTFVGSPRERRHVATGHTSGVPAPSYELDSTGKGAGDIYSTVTDLDRWNRYVSTALLSPSYRRRMFTSHAAAGHSLGSWGKGDAYGYGTYLTTTESFRMAYHSGHNSGFNAFNARLPDKDLSIVILANDDSVDPQAIAKALLERTPELRAVLRSTPL
jgi:CubicO group peptidase (beta-lactamase class C family)